MFGLTVFGLNLTRLAPGAWSALQQRTAAAPGTGNSYQDRQSASLDTRGVGPSHAQRSGDRPIGGLAQFVWVIRPHGGNPPHAYLAVSLPQIHALINTSANFALVAKAVATTVFA
jgi:hypothetical protein